MKPGTLRSLRPAIILGAAVGTLAVGTLMSGGTDAAQHPLWRPLLHARDRIALTVGEQTLGDVYITEERMLRQTITYPADAAAHAAETLNDLAARSSARVYYLPVPTSAGIYGDRLSSAAPLADEHALLSEIAGQLSENIVRLEAESWLLAEKDQYIYYRTDPRWTSYGAFCVYRPVIRRLGFTALGYERFTVSHFSDSYRGSLYARSRFDDIPADLIDLYTLSSAPAPVEAAAIYPDGHRETLTDMFQTARAQASGEPSDVFPLLNCAVLQTATRNDSSRDLLLLTDSFGAEILPFLLQHYSSITAVNLTRQTEAALESLSRFTSSDYAQVLVLCGADTLSRPEAFRLPDIR